jgi:transposase InsO family protein
VTDRLSSRPRTRRDESWSVERVRVVLENRREEYKTEHLHGSLRYLPPAEFAATRRLTPVLVPSRSIPLR